jgi:signal transduction histidine kinase
MQLPIIIFLALFSYQIFKTLNLKSFKYLCLAWVLNFIYVFTLFLSLDSGLVDIEYGLQQISLSCGVISGILFFLAAIYVKEKKISFGFLIGTRNSYKTNNKFNVILIAASCLVLLYGIIQVVVLSNLTVINNDLGYIIDLKSLPIVIYSIIVLLYLARELREYHELGVNSVFLFYGFNFYGILQLLAIFNFEYCKKCEDIQLIIGFLLGLLFKSFILYGLHKIFVNNAMKTTEIKVINENLNRILGRTFHEITAPLKTIRNKLNEFQEADSGDFRLSSATKTQLNIIENNYHRLIAVISASMKLYENGLGKGFADDMFDLIHEDEFGPNNLNTLIEIAITSIKENLAENEEMVTINREYSKNCNIMCYPNEVTQVVYNILRNSIDSFNGDKGKIFIKTKVLELEDEHNKIKVVKAEFADNGRGINVEDIEKVFHEGFTTKKNIGNRGYGLHIARELTLKNSGLIKAESPYDFNNFHTHIVSGTLVTITFPII